MCTLMSNPHLDQSSPDSNWFGPRCPPSRVRLFGHVSRCFRDAVTQHGIFHSAMALFGAFSRSRLGKPLTVGVLYLRLRASALPSKPVQRICVFSAIIRSIRKTFPRQSYSRICPTDRRSAMWGRIAGDDTLRQTQSTSRAPPRRVRVPGSGTVVVGSPDPDGERPRIAASA